MYHHQEGFHIVGISVRTTNENNQSAIDIPNLWNTFIQTNVAANIPNKLNDTIYCIYTDYEKDHTKPYTTIIGCRVVEQVDNVPSDMVSLTIPPSNYEVFTVKGNLNEGAVYNEWLKIWNADIPRIFTSDFEVYDAKSQNPADAAVDIFIAVKPISAT